MSYSIQLPGYSTSDLFQNSASLERDISVSPRSFTSRKFFKSSIDIETNFGMVEDQYASKEELKIEENYSQESSQSDVRYVYPQYSHFLYSLTDYNSKPKSEQKDTIIKPGESEWHNNDKSAGEGEGEQKSEYQDSDEGTDENQESELSVEKRDDSFQKSSDNDGDSFQKSEAEGEGDSFQASESD